MAAFLHFNQSDHGLKVIRLNSADCDSNHIFSKPIRVEKKTYDRIRFGREAGQEDEHAG